MLQDNGAWLESLHFPNVSLLSEGVERMNSRGIDSSEKEHEFDTVIFATGFKAQDFFYPIDIDGGSGNFKSIYKDSPQSYLGITFSSMPNFFAMYGPGTNLAHAGSIIFNSECQINYICSAIEYMLNNDHKVIKVKSEIEKQYQDKNENDLEKIYKYIENLAEAIIEEICKPKANEISIIDDKKQEARIRTKGLVDEIPEILSF